MNYYPRHLGDYAKDAGHLSMLEHGAYTMLLDRLYITERPIPADQAYRLCRAKTRDERQAVDSVLAEFWRMTDEGWINGRAMEEIEKLRKSLVAAQENGRKGGRPRKPSSTEVEPNGNPTGFDWDRDGVPKSKLTKHQTPNTKETPLPPDGGTPVEPAGHVALTIPCPYEAIVAAYHEALPELPRVRVTTAVRQRAMRKRWGWVLSSRKPDGSKRAESATQALAWFAAFFARVRESDFLMGRTSRGVGHEGWECDIDFLLSDRGLKQVVEKTRDAA